MPATHARYAEEHLPDHPLANSRGNVVVHRRLLYERIGSGDHACRHCGKVVRWLSKIPKADALCVDHINEDWRDNSGDNLAPTCWLCNVRHSYRGNLPWSRKVKVDCPTCGVAFLSRGTLNGEPYRKHCSKSCAVKAQWQSGALAGAKRKDHIRGYRNTEHRNALFAKIGPGPHPCHWCGVAIEWKRKGVGPGAMAGVLVADHLNSVKSDNRPENLVPSCNSCNIRRAHIGPRIVVACECCGKPFERQANVSNPKYGRFCSRSCRSKTVHVDQMLALVEARKIPAGELFIVDKGHGNKRRAVNSACSWCGQTFLKPVTSTAKYCNSRCYGNAMRGKSREEFRGSTRSA